MILFCPKCQKNVLAQGGKAHPEASALFKRQLEEIEGSYMAGRTEYAHMALEIRDLAPKPASYTCSHCHIELWREETHPKDEPDRREGK